MGFEFNKKNRILAGIFNGLIITAICSVLIYFNIFANLHEKFSNTLYTRDEVSEDIIIVAIDKKSTQSEPEGLGIFFQWNRNNYSDLLESLELS